MKVLKYTAIGIVLVVLGVFGYMKVVNKNFNELALSVLTIIKNTKGDKVNLNKITPSQLKSIDHSEWSALVDKFVSEDGRVEYRGLLKSKFRLNQYLDYLSQNAPAPNWTESEKLAYWINAYNAFTVKLILDHYPINSIKDISDGLPMIDSPWDLKFFKIGGVDFDLNTIEHEILRKQFDEPRIHFAINCASVSCPKLRNEAYLPKYLEQQLDDQSRYFINNKRKNNIDSEELQLSRIFSWFRGDFTENGSLQSFLRRYNKDMGEKSKITYLEYDWGLNE